MKKYTLIFLLFFNLINSEYGRYINSSDFYNIGSALPDPNQSFMHQGQQVNNTYSQSFSNQQVVPNPYSNQNYQQIPNQGYQQNAGYVAGYQNTPQEAHTSLVEEKLNEINSLMQNKKNTSYALTKLHKLISDNRLIFDQYPANLNQVIGSKHSSDSLEFYVIVKEILLSSFDDWKFVDYQDNSNLEDRVTRDFSLKLLQSKKKPIKPISDNEKVIMDLTGEIAAFFLTMPNFSPYIVNSQDYIDLVRIIVQSLSVKAFTETLGVPAAIVKDLNLVRNAILTDDVDDLKNAALASGTNLRITADFFEQLKFESNLQSQIMSRTILFWTTLLAQEKPFERSGTEKLGDWSDNEKFILRLMTETISYNPLIENSNLFYAKAGAAIPQIPLVKQTLERISEAINQRNKADSLFGLELLKHVVEFADPNLWSQASIEMAKKLIMNDAIDEASSKSLLSFRSTEIRKDPEFKKIVKEVLDIGELILNNLNSSWRNFIDVRKLTLDMTSIRKDYIKGGGAIQGTAYQAAYGALGTSGPRMTTNSASVNRPVQTNQSRGVFSRAKNFFR